MCHLYKNKELLPRFKFFPLIHSERIRIFRKIQIRRQYETLILFFITLYYLRFFVTDVYIFMCVPVQV